MENFFHGTSSGTDPLICYLNTAVLLNSSGVKKVELPEAKPPFTFFLLDTYIKRSATVQIEYFLKKNEEADFNKKIKKDYLPNIDTAIDAYIKRGWEKLFNQFNFISEFQFLFLDKMIPEGFKEIWEVGLVNNYFKLKICGAGGGGFILGMTSDFEKMKNEFETLNFLKI